MPKSNYTRKTTARSKSTPRRSSRKTTTYYSSCLTVDQKLNFIGGVLVLVGILGLVALFANKNGLFTGWIATTTGQIAGWGGIILPLAMLLLGITLLLRHYDRLPHVSGMRIGGIVLIYFNLLTWFHFFEGGGFASARLGRGGGFIGAGLHELLVNTLGRAGEAVVLAAWFLIALIFIIDISLPELANHSVALVKKVKANRPAPIPRQASFDDSQAKSRSGDDSISTELPAGFNRLEPDESAVRMEGGVRRHETTGRSSTAAQSTQHAPAVKPSDSAAQPTPIVRTNVTRSEKPWPMPSVADILDPASPAIVQSHYDKERARIIEETLASFGAPAHIVEIHRGPAVTQYGVEPDFIESRTGRTRVRVAKIVNLADDLALALAAPSIRIQAPVPGKAYVGIEVPNSELSLVSLRELIETEAFRKIKSTLRFAFGKDVAGKPVCADLTSMPHLLVAGTTNSGKSVLVNAILTSLLLNNSPADLRLVLVDPKRVELTGYNGIPHLLAPVVVDAERVTGALQWVLREMDSRYKRFANAGARNISDFNRKSGEHIPYLVIVIDELADLMMLAPDETERSITRLAQLARATGIHLIISTQRPSVDVVTGLIKANFPARVAFMVASGTDSRVILDQPGAERLLGRGDMLYQAPDAPAPVRLQGVYVSDPEIQRLVDTWRVIAMNRRAEGGEELYDASLEMLPSGVPLKQGSFFGDDLQAGDPMLKEAIDVVRREGKASISMLQRRLRVGYNRAARLIDALEEQKIIGPQQAGMQVREVLDYGEQTNVDPDTTE
ncbi:MAG: DNA translocase FtsK [Anaerolineaceae bacterium]|nr:DNA translocase FtsK [Anaerolineaceae bacterium]